MSRRRFLALSVAAAGVSTVGLAACGSRSKGASSIELQIASPAKPVKFALTSDNAAIKAGLSNEAGPLRIANFADYVAPELLDKFKSETGVTVELSTFGDDVEALSKISTGAFKVDLLMSTAIDLLPKYVALNLVQPLEKSYFTNYENLWDSVRDPFYDLGGQFTVPYTVFSTGIGFRSDLVAAPLEGDSGWDALWDSQYSGVAGLVDSYREALALGLQHAGIDNINTESQTDIDAAVAELRKMFKASNPRLDVLGYQSIPEGTTTINQLWSGDILAAQGYLPEGTDSSVLGYWVPPIAKRVINNDAMSIMRSAEHPVLAHAFINFMLDPENAKINQAYIGYQSTLKGFEAETLVAEGTIPENLANALVTQDDFTKGLRILALPAAADKMWQDAWSSLRTGA